MIKCEHLVKKYMSTTAVSDLSLDIISGNIYALLGPNGSGKSTLMKMIAGLSKPTSGTITMDNRPLDYKAKAHIAYMPTEAYFFGYMNCIDVGENITVISSLILIMTNTCDCYRKWICRQSKKCVRCHPV